MLKTILPNLVSKMLRQGNEQASQKSGGQSQAESGVKQKHPLVEAGLGRHVTRGYIESFTRRLQDAYKNKGRMGRVLQPTTRIGQTEGSSETKERRVNRALEIVRIAKDKGYQHWIDQLLAIEGDAYYSLRVPHEVRNRNESLEYFIGIQAGRLAVVDDLRVMIQQAEIELQKEQEAEKKDYERQQRRES